MQTVDTFETLKLLAIEAIAQAQTPMQLTAAIDLHKAMADRYEENWLNDLYEGSEGYLDSITY